LYGGWGSRLSLKSCHLLRESYVAIRSLFPTENRSRFLRPYFSVFTTPLRAGSHSYSFFFIISAIG